MAYYSYNNTKVLINGDLIYANKADISMNTDLSPNYFEGDRTSLEHSAVGGTKGNLSISYFLTGADPLKKYVTKEKDVITGNFAGLFFNSGYLTSLNFNASPHAPVSIEAKIDFYGDLLGTFTPTTEQIPSNKVLVFSDAKINESGIGKDKIKDLTYSYSSEIKPNYVEGDINPSNIRFLKKYSNLSMNTYGISGELDYKGKDISIDIQLNNSTGIAEKYKVEGPLLSRKTSSQAGEKISSNISVTQNFIDEKPNVTSFTTSGTAMALGGEGFEIHGSNLTNVTSMVVGDRRVDNLQIVSDAKVSGHLAEDTLPGSQIVHVNAFGGNDTSQTITVGDAGL